MKQRIITSLFLVAMIATVALGQRGWNWTEVAEMGVPRAEHMSAVVDGEIYVFGGRMHERMGRMMTLASAEKYNPEENEWVDIRPMPYPLCLAGVTAVGEFIYLLGGTTRGEANAIDSILVYDTNRNTYTVRGSMPEAKHSLEIAYFPPQRSLLVAGGIGSRFDDFFRSCHWNNVGNRGWEDAIDLPNPMGKFGLTYGADSLWIVGGFSFGGATNRTYVYTQRGWKQRANCPAPIGDHGAVFLGDTLVIAGGVRVEGLRQVILDEVYGYLPGTNRWIDLPQMTTPRTSFELVAIGDSQMFAIGGQRERQQTLSSVEVCQPVNAIEDNPDTPSRRVVSISPNPTRGSVRFLLPSGNNRIRIVDLNGRILADKTLLNSSDWTWSSKGFPNGTYFYSVTYENSLPISGRIVVIK